MSLDGSRAREALVLSTCLCALVVHAAVGCSADTAATQPARSSLSVPVRFDTSTPSDALLLWDIRGSSAYISYAWGRAALSDGKANIQLAGRPPSDAVNADFLGVAFVMIFPSGSLNRSGPFTAASEADRTEFAGLLGASTRHAVIFTDQAAARRIIDGFAADASPQTLERARQSWVFQFPDGYSCGKSLPPPAGGRRDDVFAPVDCAEFAIQPGSQDTLKFPDWT